MSKTQKTSYRAAFIALLEGECPDGLYPVEGSPNCDNCDGAKVCWQDWFISQEHEGA